MDPISIPQTIESSAREYKDTGNSSILAATVVRNIYYSCMTNNIYLYRRL